MSLGVLHAGPSCCGGISVRALRHKLRKGVPPFPQKEEDTNPYASAYQTYEVSATVTDSKGETQEANYTFSVGESSIVLFTNLPPQIEKDSVKAVVEARTINGEMVSTSGTFKIVELIANRSDKNSGESYQEGKHI